MTWGSIKPELDMIWTIPPLPPPALQGLRHVSLFPLTDILAPSEILTY